MKLTVTNVNRGNPNRGYHNTDSTFTFEYDGGGYYDTKREKEIVDFILGSSWMWYRYTREEEIKETREMVGTQQPYEFKTGAVYVVNHGYDSGD